MSDDRLKPRGASAIAADDFASLKRRREFGEWCARRAILDAVDRVSGRLTGGVGTFDRWIVLQMDDEEISMAALERRDVVKVTRAREAFRAELEKGNGGPMLPSIPEAADGVKR